MRPDRKEEGFAMQNEDREEDRDQRAENAMEGDHTQGWRPADGSSEFGRANEYGDSFIDGPGLAAGEGRSTNSMSPEPTIGNTTDSETAPTDKPNGNAYGAQESGGQSSYGSSQGSYSGDDIQGGSAGRESGFGTGSTGEGGESSHPGSGSENQERATSAGSSSTGGSSGKNSEHRSAGEEIEAAPSRREE
jgi:hypothetical protein